MSELKVGQRVLFMSDDDSMIPYLSYGRVVEPKHEDLITVDFGDAGVWHCGKGEVEPMYCDLKAMFFNPGGETAWESFAFGNTPEGYKYWEAFHFGTMTEEEAEVAQAKWDAMKKQWYEENCPEALADYDEVEGIDPNFKSGPWTSPENWQGITSFGADLTQSLKEAFEMNEGGPTEPLREAWEQYESLLVDTPEQHYTPKDIKPMDNVKHPNHYNQDGEVECIDAIKASLGTDGFTAYCKGNCMKYLWRYKYKNGVEDLEKAKVYLEWMIETMRSND